MELNQSYLYKAFLLLCYSDLLRNGRIDHPDHFALCLFRDKLRRVFLWLVGTLQDSPQRLGFIGSGDHKEDVMGRVQQRWGEGQAVGGRLGHRNRHDQPFLLPKRGLVWEKRGRVRLRSHAKLNQVKGGHIAAAQDSTNLPGIVCRSLFAIGPVGWHAMDLLGTQIQFAQHDLLRQVIVALRVRWWDTALVTPEEVNRVPIDLATERLAGQQAIHLARRCAP